MGLITTLSMQEGFCYASNKYLSNLMKVSKRTITSCISSLRKKKYIKVECEPNIDLNEIIISGTINNVIDNNNDYIKFGLTTLKYDKRKIYKDFFVKGAKVFIKVI